MSVDFRQRKPSEYLKILRRRKWLLILPDHCSHHRGCVMSSTGSRMSTSQRRSSLSDLPIFPLRSLPSASEDSMTRQLTSINQVVTSRSSLEPLVDKYDLYRVERSRGEPMETVIETMRDNIRVAVNTSRNDITNGFNIAYQISRSKNCAGHYGGACEQVHQRSNL